MKFVLLLIVEVLQNFGDEIIDSRTRKEGIGCGREQGAQRHTDRQRQRESLARFALRLYDTRDQEPDEQQVRVWICGRHLLQRGMRNRAVVGDAKYCSCALRRSSSSFV